MIRIPESFVPPFKCVKLFCGLCGEQVHEGQYFTAQTARLVSEKQEYVFCTTHEATMQERLEDIGRRRAELSVASNQVVEEKVQEYAQELFGQLKPKAKGKTPRRSRKESVVQPPEIPVPKSLNA